MRKVLFFAPISECINDSSFMPFSNARISYEESTVFFVFFASISGCINDSSLLLTAKICLMESINFITFSNARISYEESIFFFFFFFFFLPPYQDVLCSQALTTDC